MVDKRNIMFPQVVKTKIVCILMQLSLKKKSFPLINITMHSFKCITKKQACKNMNVHVNEIFLRYSSQGMTSKVRV